MKRDDEYIREMLFEAEESSSYQYLASKPYDDSDEDKKRHYHAELLCDAGFFVRLNPEGVYRMTSQGHDYLDAIRDETIWNKTKEVAVSIGGGTLSMLLGIAVELLKKEAAEKFGIPLP